MSNGFSNPSGVSNSRKSKIMSFVEKDLFILNNYESVRFKNKNHAIECLIPYHVFQVMADDVKFSGSNVTVNLGLEVEQLVRRVESIIEDSAYSDAGFTPQLLLYHEQRYLNSLAQQSQSAAGSTRDKTGTKSGGAIKLPKCSTLHVYGRPDAIRIRFNRIDRRD